VFKRGGAERTAGELESTFLGRIPLDPAIVAGGDAGEPIVVSEPDSAHASAFQEVAKSVVVEVGKRQAQKVSIV